MAEKDHATPILDAIAAGERYAHGAHAQMMMVMMMVMVMIMEMEMEMGNSSALYQRACEMRDINQDGFNHSARS